MGQMLKEKRIAKGWNLERIEQATRIRRKYLEAIERDEYKILPSTSYAKGFIKNYGDLLGLNSTELLAFFRRQTIDGQKQVPFPKQVDDPRKRSILELTPGKFVAFLITGLFGMLLLYFGLQYKRLNQPPTLRIENPKDGTETKARRVDVEGVTDSDATITVNGVTVLVRSDGRFFEQIPVGSGENTITITATSRYGKSINVQRKVNYKE